MGKYRKKPITVEAYQLLESKMILTAHGRVRAEAGDWVLTDPISGDIWPVKPDLFAATYYELVGEEEPNALE